MDKEQPPKQKKNQDKPKRSGVFSSSLKEKIKKKKEEKQALLKQQQNSQTAPLTSPNEKSPEKKSSDKVTSISSSKKSLNKALTTLNEKLTQALNDNLYLRAEFENFKRRTSEEKVQLIRYNGEHFIAALANEVLDDWERAMHSAQKEESLENLKKGLEMIHKKLLQFLSHFGVEILDPSGKAFDPSYQDALSYIKTSQVPEGHVAEVIKKAYKLHDKVIRPAQVVLAKTKEDS